MAQKKTRLQRKLVGGRKETRLEIPKSMRQLSNKQVEAYAATKARDPIAKAVKQAALAEVARRNRMLQQWKRGAPPKKKKGKPLFKLPKRKEIPKEALKAVRGGVGILGKALSGELAREFEEGIATVGMKPEQKREWKAEQKAKERKRVAEEKKEIAEMRKFGFGG